MGAQEQGHDPDLAHNWAVLIGPEDQPRPQAVFIFPHPESSYSSYQDRGIRDQIANINWVIEKAREFQKNIFCLNDYTKAFDCVEHNKLWKILKEMGIPDHLTCFLTCIQISQEAGRVVWYSHVFQNFAQFIVIHAVKGFDIVNKTLVYSTLV